jgi:hypothetical protein
MEYKKGGDSDYKPTALEELASTLVPKKRKKVKQTETETTTTTSDVPALEGSAGSKKRKRVTRPVLGREDIMKMTEEEIAAYVNTLKGEELFTNMAKLKCLRRVML